MYKYLQYQGGVGGSLCKRCSETLININQKSHFVLFYFLILSEYLFTLCNDVAETNCNLMCSEM